MLFDVLAVQSTESILKPLWDQFMMWLKSKYPKLSNLIAKYSNLIYLTARGILESYFLYNYNASFVEYYYGLERQGMIGTSVSMVKLLISVLANLIGPFLKDKLKNNPGLNLCLPTTSLLCFLLYATGWTTGHDLVFSLLGMQLKYREEGDVDELNWSLKSLFKPSVSILMYSLRLLQFAIEQSSVDHKGIIDNNKFNPMPINLKPVRPFTAESLKTVKKWNCPVCCQPLLGNNPISHSSGYVFCAKCIDLDNHDDGLVECPVTRAKSAKKHLRRLHL